MYVQTDLALLSSQNKTANDRTNFNGSSLEMATHLVSFFMKLDRKVCLHVIQMTKINFIRTCL